MQCVCNKQSIIIIEFRAWSGAKSGGGGGGSGRGSWSTPLMRLMRI